MPRALICSSPRRRRATTRSTRRAEEEELDAFCERMVAEAKVAKRYEKARAMRIADAKTAKFTAVKKKSANIAGKAGASSGEADPAAVKAVEAGRDTADAAEQVAKPKCG